MTLAELNWHFALRDKLEKARETMATLRQKALPGASALTGMPHTPGVSDKVGDLAAEIADMDAYIQYIEAWAEVSSVIGGPNSEESVKKMCYRYLTDQ